MALGIPGRLIQPLVKVKWGDLDLTEYPVGAGVEPVFHDLKIDIQEKDQVPTCEFAFSPNVPGFEAFQKCVVDNKDKPVIVTIGYLGGTEFKMKFFFTGLTFSTGLDTSAMVFLTVATKGAWTDNRVSFTMTEQDKVTLAAFPDKLKAIIGDAGKDINVQFVGQLAEDASKIEIIINVIQQTPMQIIEGLARAMGFKIENGDTVFDGGPIVLGYSPNYEPNKQKDKPVVLGKPGTPKPAERKCFILGPGLIETFTREMKFNTNISGFDIGKSFKEPGSFEIDNKDIIDTKTDAGEKAAQAENKAGGTAGKSTGKTPSQKGVRKSAGVEKPARSKKEQEENITASTEFFMVPYAVGIKPRDFIAIPSLKIPCQYVEDWIVDRVSYTQAQEGGMKVSVQCKRPLIGTENVMDEATVKSVKDIANGMIDTKDWYAMYWGT